MLGRERLVGEEPAELGDRRGAVAALEGVGEVARWRLLLPRPGGAIRGLYPRVGVRPGSCMGATAVKNAHRFTGSVTLSISVALSVI